MTWARPTIIDLMRALLMIAIVLGVLGAAAIARAGDLPSAASATNPITHQSHAWIADRNLLGGVKILHLPPRGSEAGGRRGADDGAVGTLTILAQMPEAMAAEDARLYLVFPPPQTNAKPMRQVLMFEARRGSFDGTWSGEPSGSRLPVLPALPGDCRLQGFVGTPAGPVALIDRDGPDPMPVEELLLLSDDKWRSITLPPSLSSRPLDPAALQVGDTGLRLVGTSDGIRLIILDAHNPGSWTARLSVPKGGRSADSDSRPLSAAWAWEPLSFEAAPQGTIRPSGAIWQIGDQLVFDRRNYEGVELWTVSSKGCERIAAAPRVGAPYGAVALDQTGRFALVWTELSVDGLRQIPEMRVFEASVRTGQVLFDGAAAKLLPISSLDVKVLAVFLVCVMLAIVIFVLRPDRAREPLILPKGTALAEPARRAIAGGIDAVVAVLLASQVTRIDLAEALTFDSLIRGTHTVWLMLAAIGIGFVLSTIGEALFGRSIGKALSGCEVVVPRVTKGAEGEVKVELQRVALWRAAVRNLVKWLIPPVAMSGVSSAEGRHRGDTAAGTVVIIRHSLDAAPDGE